MSRAKMLGDIASVTVLRIGMAALGFGLFWLLSHRLPTEELGGYSVLMNTFFMVQSLPLLGLNARLIRHVAAQPTSLAMELSNSLVFALPGAALIAVGLSVYGWSLEGSSLFLPYVLLGVAMLPSAWTLVAESALVGCEAVRSVAYVNLVEALWRLLGAWLAVSQGWGLTGVFAFFLMGRVGAAVAYLLNAQLPRPSWALINTAMQYKYLSEVPTYLGLALLVATTARADVLVLSSLRGLQDVGVYAAAARLYEASLMLSTIAVMVAFPILSRLYIADRPAFLAALERGLRWSLLLGMPLVLLGMALAPWLVRHVYAPALWPAAPLLQLLLIATWLMALDQLLSSTMLAAQAQRQDLVAMSLGLLALLALLVGLNQVWGLPAAAAGVALALALRIGWRLAWAQRALPVQGLLSHGLRSGLAALAGLVVFWRVQASQGPWLALLAGCSAHALVALVCGAWNAEHQADWRRLNARWLHWRQG